MLFMFFLSKVKLKMNSSIELIIEEKMEGARLDVVLSLWFEEMSRSYLQKLIEVGNVRVNGHVCKTKKRQMKQLDIVNIDIPPPKTIEIEKENIPLEIIYEDEDVLIVNKPKGMVVHPAPGNYKGTLVNAIMYHCGESLSSINGIIRPGIVHRIDKDTSGLLIIAKNDFSHNSIASQLKEHTIIREYRAVVYNNFKENEGTINEPIGRDPKNRLRNAVTSLNSKEAITHYKVLERFGDFTYLKLNLETGRTHQIRVHMAYIKHPLLGDFVYGPNKTVFGVEGQLLHAKKIGFIHPRKLEYMEFDSELPYEFQKVLLKLRERL